MTMPDPKTTANPPLLGYAFWTTDLVPNEFGYHGPIHVLVGMGLIALGYEPASAQLKSQLPCVAQNSPATPAFRAVFLPPP